MGFPQGNPFTKGCLWGCLSKLEILEDHKGNANEFRRARHAGEIFGVFSSKWTFLENYKKVSKFETEIFLIILLIFVGLRDATGGDYYTYFDMFLNIIVYY